MIDHATMTIGWVLAAGVVGIWCSRRKPLHLASRQSIPLETAQKAVRQAKEAKALAFETSGERYYFVAIWDRDNNLPTFFSNGHKTVDEARQAAEKFMKSIHGPVEIWDAKEDKPVTKLRIEAGGVISAVEM